MKTKKQYLLQKQMASKENFEKTVERDIETLQKECDYEINRLQRLRNEIKDIEAQKKSFEVEKQSFKNKEDAFYKDVVIQKSALAVINSVASSKEANAKKYLQEASDKLKSAQATLKTAEARETIATDISKVNQNLLQKAKAIEAKNEKAIQILVDQQNKTDAIIGEEKAFQKKNAIDKANNERKLLELNKLQESIKAEQKKNEEKIATAKLLNIQAQETLNKARAEAKASQFSIEQQQNTIDIENTKLRARELKLKKEGK